MSSLGDNFIPPLVSIVLNHRVKPNCENLATISCTHISTLKTTSDARKPVREPLLKDPWSSGLSAV